MHNPASVIAFVGLLVFLAHLFTAMFSRTKVPDVLMLIIIGLVSGPVLHVVTPEHFGAVGPVFSTVALVIILFEGGMGLRLRDLHRTFGGMLNLTLTTFIITVTASASTAHYMAGVSIYGSVMLGAVLGATSPAVVIPLVKQLKMKAHARTILTMESATSEVLCIVLVIALIEAYVTPEVNAGYMVGKVIASFFIASFLGVVGAVGWSTLLSRVRTLENSIFTTPAFVFIIYGIVELLGYNGPIAALAFGVTLGNIWIFNRPSFRKFLPVEPIAPNRTEKIFFSEFVFLLKTFFFVYIGISMKFAESWVLFTGVVITLLIYIFRIPVVRLTVDRTNTVEEASIMSVMVPKGLASAVVASLPLQAGFPEGLKIQELTYAVVLFSIALTSALIFLIGKTGLAGVYGYAYTGFRGKGETARPDSGDCQSPEMEKLDAEEDGSKVA